MLLYDLALFNTGRRQPMNRWKIITITGASGSGKTTVTRELLKTPNTKLIQSLTTRAARDSDLPGEYIYGVSREELSRAKQNGLLLWDIETHGNIYGTVKTDVDQALIASCNSLMMVVPEVVPILHAYTPKPIISFFLVSPDKAVLRERLVNRGDPPEQIERRLSDCDDWLDQAIASSLPYRFVRTDAEIKKIIFCIHAELKLLNPINPPYFHN